MDELHTFYHNCVLHVMKGILRQFLFARFAWDIFPRLRNFLLARVSRRLKTSLGVENCSPEDIRDLCEREGRNRSLSPKKASSPTKRPRPRPRSEIVEADSQSFDSGIGGIRRQRSNSECDEVDLRDGSDQDYWDEESDDWWLKGQEWVQCGTTIPCTDQNERLPQQNSSDATSKDPHQEELNQWKIQNGLMDGKRREERKRACSETQAGIKHIRGRKRFRSDDDVQV